MKTFLFFIITCVAMNTAFADCSSSGMRFFPEQNEVSLNSMFIIQGYGMSQETIIGFKTRKVYLESKNGELVELKLVEILKGQMSLTQAVFKPIKELSPNTIYFLKYAKQTKDELNEIERYNIKTNKTEKVFWTTTDKKSSESSFSNLNVEFEKTEVVAFGCGPSANAIFKVSANLDSKIWYKTEVIELETQHKTTYYLSASNGKLEVGHGMCAGAFTFNQKGKYKVKFTLLNMDGKVLKETESITFKSPFINGF